LGLNLQLAADHGIINNNTAGATFTVTGAIDLNNHNLTVGATLYSARRRLTARSATLQSAARAV